MEKRAVILVLVLIFSLGIISGAEVICGDLSSAKSCSGNWNLGTIMDFDLELTWNECKAFCEDTAGASCCEYGLYCPEPDPDTCAMHCAPTSGILESGTYSATLCGGCTTNNDCTLCEECNEVTGACDYIGGEMCEEGLICHSQTGGCEIPCTSNADCPTCQQCDTMFSNPPKCGYIAEGYKDPENRCNGWPDIPDILVCDGNGNCVEPGTCGDGNKGLGEACDESDFGILTCEFFGLEGDLTCDNECNIDVSSCEWGCAENQIIMKISDELDAHGEVYNGLNYDVEICYNTLFGVEYTGALPHNCDETSSNKVLRLSRETNAHAETPESSTPGYIDMCYGDLECNVRNNNCNSDETEVITLSDVTNAHLSETSFSTKICCKRQDECANRLCVSGEAYWANVNDIRYLIDHLDAVVPDTTQVAMVLKNAQTTNLDFEIYEDDPVLPGWWGSSPGNNEIRTGSDAITGSLNEQGDAVAYWTVTVEDLTKTTDRGEFYFMIDGKPSGYLALTVLDSDACLGIYSCIDYTEGTMCGEDSCGRAVFDVESIPDLDITCGDGYICQCAWDEVNGCGATWTAVINGLCGNGIPETGEECDDGNTDNNDGCSSDCEYKIVPPPCPVGTTLCSDNTCSINCDDTDQGTTCDYDGTCDPDEGCTCRDCNGEPDTCLAGLECSIIDEACCRDTNDGTCTPNCAYIDPDCVGGSCGNGIQETGEECDDKNTDNGDGCSSDCEFEDDITPPCLIGLTLCSDNTCSINCGATDDGTTCDYDGTCDPDEGCTCRDCNGEPDTCLAGLECSIADQACCKDTHDGICIPNCAFIDPDCVWAIDPDDPEAGEIGTCTYTEGGSDNCDDGFLHYQWSTDWGWGNQNGFLSPNLGPSNNPNHYIIIPPVTGLHYFDPERLSENCNGIIDKTIVCPAKMQLTFFNLMNLVITIVVLTAFYIVFKKYKKKKKK